MKILPEALDQVPAKAIRMSAVALSAAVMAVVWIVIDEYTSIDPPAVLVSAVTSLVMLLAQFTDVKARHDGAEVIDPSE